MHVVPYVKLCEAVCIEMRQNTGEVPQCFLCSIGYITIFDRFLFYIYPYYSAKPHCQWYYHAIVHVPVKYPPC